jgi:hypothetical protein
VVRVWFGCLKLVVGDGHHYGIVVSGILPGDPGSCYGQKIVCSDQCRFSFTIKPSPIIKSNYFTTKQTIKKKENKQTNIISSALLEILDYIFSVLGGLFCHRSSYPSALVRGESNPLALHDHGNHGIVVDFEHHHAIYKACT